MMDFGTRKVSRDEVLALHDERPRYCDMASAAETGLRSWCRTATGPISRASA
jgi:hypothetical protein